MGGTHSMTNSRILLNMIFVLFLLISKLDLTAAFDDLRDKECRATKIGLPNIQDQLVEWLGEITLGLECDNGYDVPLNFDPNEITCKGDNKWEPDFFPDCNIEIMPEKDKKCPLGSTHTATSKGERCRGCPIGQHLAGDKCKPCAKGYYQDKPMSESCKKCPSLEKVASTSSIWAQVRRVTGDRLFHVLGCPVLITLNNGTVVVMASQQDYMNAMKRVIHDRHPEDDTTGSGKKSAAGLSWMGHKVGLVHGGVAVVAALLAVAAILLLDAVYIVLQ